MKALLLLLLLAACAEGAGSCDLQRVAELPVEVVSTVPLVTAQINGRPARLVVDTGADTTALSRTAAHRLGVGWDERAPVGLGGAGGRGQAFATTLAGVELGGSTTPNVRALITNTLPPPIDGVLGINVLVGYELDLDVPHRRLVLYRARPCPAALPPWTAPYTRLPVQQQPGGRLYVSAELDTQPVFALLDTGASNTTVAPGPARDAGVTAAALRAAPAFRAQAFNEGGLVGREQRFRSLRVGNDVLDRPLLHIADLPAYAGEMIVGGDYLTTRRLWLSFIPGRAFVTSSDQPEPVVQPRPR